MHDAVRNLLLLALAGALVTVAGSAAVWWRDEERRLRRYLRRALGAPPESVIIASGRGRAAGLSLERGLIAVLWDGGMKGLIYRLPQLVGAELILDDEVAARAFRGETRRALDQAPNAAHRVILRLIFDNPRDPDFELELWPPVDTSRRERHSARECIAAGRRWISGVEAILRQSSSAHASAYAEDDEPEPQRPPPPPPRPTPPPLPSSTSQPGLFDEAGHDEPPWDIDDDEVE